MVNETAQASIPNSASKRRKNKPVLTQNHIVLVSVTLLILTGISGSLFRLTLSPVYGSLPSTLYHQTALTCTVLLAFAAKSPLKRLLPANKVSLLPVLAFYIPVAQSLLFRFSGSLGATYGPLVTEGLSLLPLLILTLHLVHELTDGLIPSGYTTRLTGLVKPALSYLVLYAAEGVSNAFVTPMIGANALLSRIGLQYVLASTYGILLPSKHLVLMFPSLLHLFFFNSHVPLPINTAVLNSTLHNHGFRLLERHESVTGYISVLENVVDGFRVMRCDHSLLGGEWLVTPERLKQGITVKEPVYAVFSMLEAVRLVVGQEGEGTTAREADKDKKALVIGLGVGTAPSALLHHGINTTIIELDPVVHAFATRYFDLLSNHTAVIQNAVTWVENAVSPAADMVRGEKDGWPIRYDYIIHDVFTGGAEPLELFTMEFLEGLYELLKPGGAIAINYAADLSLPTTPLILTTILSVFSEQNCRIFRDQPPVPTSPSPSQNPTQTLPSDFVNAVIFCHKPSSSPPPLPPPSPPRSPSHPNPQQPTWSFRPATPQDHLNSHSRKTYIPPPQDLEMSFSSLLQRTHEQDIRNGISKETQNKRDAQLPKVLRKDDKNTMREMRKWQIQGAVRHWGIMRGVLPGVVWEAW